MQASRTLEEPRTTRRNCCLEQPRLKDVGNDKPSMVDTVGRRVKGRGSPSASFLSLNPGKPGLKHRAVPPPVCDMPLRGRSPRVVPPDARQTLLAPARAASILS